MGHRTHSVIDDRLHATSQREIEIAAHSYGKLGVTTHTRGIRGQIDGMKRVREQPQYGLAEDLNHEEDADEDT